MNDSHLLNASEAARAVGVTVAAISRALKCGRLPYVEKTTKGYRIDPSTLFHVFRGMRVAQANGEAGRIEETGDLMPEVMALRIANAQLETELRSLHRLLDSERMRADTAAHDREGWQRMCEWLLKEKSDPAG